MSYPELILVAIGLSMDAFAVAICIGLKLKKADLKKSLLVGLYFGFFQAIMPLIGYIFASQLDQKIIAYDHWIAFILLVIIGGKMVIDGLQKEGYLRIAEKPDTVTPCPVIGCGCPEDEKLALSPKAMIPLAVATSIDALAIGVSFAVLQVDIVPTILAIGSVTLLISVMGVKIGNAFGSRFKGKAELVGGTILILIGVKILLEHLQILTIG